MTYSGKPNEGDKVTLGARFLGRLIDLANKPDGNATGISANNRPDIIQIKNTSGGAVDPQGILAVGDSIYDPADDELQYRYKRPVFEGNTPVYGDDNERFVIVPAGLAANEIGPALLYGITAVQIDIVDTNDKYAAIAQTGPARERLQSVAIGPALILSSPGTTGVAWCLIRWPETKRALYATATSDPSGGTLNVKLTEADGTLVGDDIEVYDGGIT